MDSLDDSENNAKISDSGYSNSCSNSQSIRSHSTKSTHSGSNSSGSSGYGEKPIISGNSVQPPKKRVKEKDPNMKKQSLLIATVTTQAQPEEEIKPVEPVQAFETPKEDKIDVDQPPLSKLAEIEVGPENMETDIAEKNSVINEVQSCNLPMDTENFASNKTSSTLRSEGFSCVISMEDGVVMYTTSSLTVTLGFPKEMWIGRSFIDFIHPKDRNTFASQITSGLAFPKIVNGKEKAQPPFSSVSTVVCRIRRYRGLKSGFGVKEQTMKFMPFLLKLTFKNISEKDGKAVYLVMRATPFISAFKVPNEVITKAVPFVMRHAANGNIEYIDPESVSYLGYLPQDVTDKDALLLYHPEDLGYLRHVYETIVKHGGMPRSKPYRMMTYNGDYIKLETEWSCFINPWSRKLEFVNGKHYIIEGPTNPDIFHTLDREEIFKISEEDKNKTQPLRDNIIRILNEVLTKPIEQQISKQCPDVAYLMESLMEEQLKTEEDLRLKIQDPDNSYFERDSVMLGGISPHHENNDSQSSTETPISYNQLNYNQNLQRYFDNHQLFQFEDYHVVPGGFLLGLKKSNPTSCPSPMDMLPVDSGETTNSCGSSLEFVCSSPVSSLGGYENVRLTEAVLNKHNAEMEKELLKMHRDTSSSTKSQRDKDSKETRKNKKEHLARCNASFRPTTSVAETAGVKRSKHMDTDSSARKHHCSSPRTSLRRQTTSTATAQLSSKITSTIVANQWPPHPLNNMNTFILGVGLPQPMSIMRPMTPQQMSTVTAMPGMFPMYYTPPESVPPIPSTSNNVNSTKCSGPYETPASQCMMYGQAVSDGSPFMYSSIAPHLSYSMQQTMLTQSMHYGNSINSTGMTSTNYEESTDVVLDTPDGASRSDKSKSTGAVNSSENVDKMDGESSYSSFYSSFFKTESGSAEESGDAKKTSIAKIRFWDSSRGEEQTSSGEATSSCHKPRQYKTVTKRKMDPPWLEQVCVTSDLMFKYQVLTRTMDEVLTLDKQKITNIKQPSLVNEQLGQLYMDMQLEGVAKRLTLEEGITSSSSSGEETSTVTPKISRKKREYSKLVMIYEEDAPLPSPPEGESTPGPSTV
ncbi:period circadian regulator [Aphomia sociella]